MKAENKRQYWVIKTCIFIQKLGIKRFGKKDIAKILSWRILN